MSFALAMVLVLLINLGGLAAAQETHGSLGTTTKSQSVSDTTAYYFDESAIEDWSKAVVDFKNWLIAQYNRPFEEIISDIGGIIFSFIISILKFIFVDYGVITIILFIILGIYGGIIDSRDKARRGEPITGDGETAPGKKRRKSGPIAGSRAVEGMLLGENYNPVNVWVARKVRDKFFRF